MLSDVHIKAIADLQAVTNIPILLFHGNGSTVRSYPEQYAQMLTDSFLTEASERCKNGILSISWDSAYHCVAVYLEDDLYLMTAPTSIMAHHQGILFHSMTDRVQPKRRAEFIHLISEIPPVGQLQLTRLGQLYRHLCNIPEAADIRQWNRSVPKLIPKQQRYEENLKPPKLKHAAFYEPHVVAAIKSGDVEKLRSSYHRPMDGYVGRMSLDDLRQARYYFVCYIFFTSRAAASGGVPWEICMQLSDRYCQQMDSLNQSDAIFDLLWNALVDYCQRVKQCNDWPGYAPSTRQCLEYIEQRVYEPIRMEQLVDYCQLNQRSISQYFRKDMGMTVPAYINKRRLKEAAVLLRETDLSLSQISSLLQYSGQSYFGKLFLQEYGVTPLQYRASHR